MFGLDLTELVLKKTHVRSVSGRGLHSSTFQLNLSAICGIWVHLGIV